MRQISIAKVKVQARKGLLYTGFYNVIASLFSLILTFGINILTARLLGPEGKGQYNLALATISLLAIYLGGSLSSGIAFVIARKPTAVNSLIKIMSVFSTAQGIVAILILFILSKSNYSRWFLPLESDNTHFIYVIGLSLIFTSLNVYFQAILIGNQDFIKLRKIELIGKFFYALILILYAILILNNGYTLSPILCLWLYSFSSAASSFLLLICLYSDLPRIASSNNIREIISYSIPCYLSDSIQFLNYRLDIFFVAYYSNSIADVGFYTMAANLAQLIWLIPQSISTVIFPKVASENGEYIENTKIITALITRLVFWISLVIGILMMLLFPLVVPIVFGKAFQPAISPFLLLLPGVISFSATKILGAYLEGSGKPKVNLFFSLIGCLVTIGLDIILIPSLGIVGAAIASSLSYITTTIGTIIFFSHRLGFSWKNLIILHLEDVRVLLLKFYAMKQQVKEK